MHTSGRKAPESHRQRPVGRVNQVRRPGRPDRGFVLSRRAGSGSQLKDLRCLPCVRDAEDQNRSTRHRLGPAVAVVDVDSSVAQPRCGASQLSRTVSQLHVRNLGLCVICALLIENRFGRCVIVQNEMNRTLALLRRERLKRDYVDVLIGESLAQLSKRSRLVFLADCELLSDRHGRNLLAVYLGDELETSCKILRSLASYSGDLPASRAKRNRFTVCRTQRCCLRHAPARPCP